jgi:hypothetical protein
MKDSRLLASAALFRELYDNDKDIYDVISEFIRASILLDSKWTFNATECNQSLIRTFGFKIPEAVIKTCLKNRLKRAGEVTFEQGVYSVTKKFDRTKSIQADFDATKNEYNDISNQLVNHIKNRSLTDINEGTIKSCFNDYMLDEHHRSEFSKDISHFLLINEDNIDFKNKLNRIEEGLVLYAGIKYSAELSNLGNWEGDLIIFMDTEHLFSATGLNGILFKQVFDDFYALVQDVNSKKRKAGSITLRFFQETSDEIDNFFYAAEKIVEKHTQIDPSKTAMSHIANGCSSKSEIVVKKADFLDQLRRLKIEIEIENSKNYYENPEYNVESSSIVNKLVEKFNHITEPSRYHNILKQFTKINCITHLPHLF